MWSMRVLYTVSILLFAEFQIEAKTYYFSLNKTTNEYIIRTRLNPNNSDINYSSAVQLSELRNNVTRKKNLNETYTHPLLDPEWDYNWNITRQKLPTYIPKFFETHSKELTGPVRIFFNANPQNSTIIRFNTSEINANENISQVELHFYQKVEQKLHQKSLILRLYQMENDYFNKTSLINPDAHKLLNVIYIFQAESGWQVFKVTNTLLNWLNDRKDLSLFMTISKPNEQQFNLFKDTNRDAVRTFMIFKTESAESAFLQNDELTIDNNSCRKHDLYIDFEKLNWKKFIISPLIFNAFNCYGTCYRNANLPNNIRVTNYFPEIARKSLCCTAVKYAPLPIMFYDKNANVVIKVYENMIITACGCR